MYCNEKVTLWLNAVNNTEYIEKALDKNCTELNFAQKTHWGACIYLSQEWR